VLVSSDSREKKIQSLTGLFGESAEELVNAVRDAPSLRDRIREQQR